MSLEKNIKKWVALDDELKRINERAKDLRNDKSTLEKDITVYIETNGLTNATIEISDGKLKYGQNKNTQPLTLKYVEKCLHELMPNNDENVNKIMTYIKDNREEKLIPNIKRSYNN
tara:strand:+ start:306 stop:653 length:348 start_codon:yes stop_codon:yes gene_type:complete